MRALLTNKVILHVCISGPYYILNLVWPSVLTREHSHSYDALTEQLGVQPAQTGSTLTLFAQAARVERKRDLRTCTSRVVFWATSSLL